MLHIYLNIINHYGIKALNSERYDVCTSDIRSIIMFALSTAYVISKLTCQFILNRNIYIFNFVYFIFNTNIKIQYNHNGLGSFLRLPRPLAETFLDCFQTIPFDS